jgi:organic hydroperoxide reductase OsmC/OhrA
MADIALSQCPPIRRFGREGLLENVEGKYRIAEVTVRPRVTLKSEAELEPARKTMESVEANCFIATSINARVTLTPEFVVAPPPK